MDQARAGEAEVMTPPAAMSKRTIAPALVADA
jgi:hypothetical protein